MNEHTHTYRALLVTGRERLERAGIETAPLDAAVLLAYVAGLTRTALYARLPEDVDSASRTRYDAMIAERERGIPVAYLVGEKEFFGLTFTVTPATLVPRPETELLVQWAIDWLTTHPNAQLAVDVGTGSGAIAVSLAHHVPGIAIVATDVSAVALRVARGNAIRHGVAGRVAFVQGDLLLWLRQSESLVIANLPYLTDTQADDAGIAAEPRTALAGGDEDGFALYRQLILQVAQRLTVDGAFAFEIDPAQATVARNACTNTFPNAEITVHQDLAGLSRFISVEK